MSDPYVGMTPEDADRARAYARNQRAIHVARQKAARLLHAPPGPAAAVKAAWAPLKAALDERRPGGGA